MLERSDDVAQHRPPVDLVGRERAVEPRLGDQSAIHGSLASTPRQCRSQVGEERIGTAEPTDAVVNPAELVQVGSLDVDIDHGGFAEREETGLVVEHPASLANACSLVRIGAVQTRLEATKWPGDTSVIAESASV